MSDEDLSDEKSMVQLRTLNPYVGVRILRPQPEIQQILAGGEEMIQPHVVTPVDWAFAPEWLTMDEACRLSGWTPDAMNEIVEAGGVDLNGDELIERGSLLEFQEAVALVLHWDD